MRELGNIVYVGQIEALQRIEVSGDWIGSARA